MSLEDSVNGLANTSPISKGFIGIILLPIVGNAAELPEQVAEVTDSLKDKLTLSLNAAVGSSIVSSCSTLFLLPTAVTLSTSKSRFSSFRTWSPPPRSTILAHILLNTGFSSCWDGYWISHSLSSLTHSSLSYCSFQVRLLSFPLQAVHNP